MFTKQQIELLYIDNIEYRESYVFHKDGEALSILVQITNGEAQELILNNLQSVTCVSKNKDGFISFFIMNGAFEDTVGYKIIGDTFIRKTYSTEAPIGVIFTDIQEESVFLYGASEVSGGVEVDMYMRTLPDTIASNFKQLTSSEGFTNFYGCKVREDGSTYRYKSFSLSLDLDKQHKAFVETLDIETAKKELAEVYNT